MNILRIPGIFIADYAYAAYWQVRGLLWPVREGRYKIEGATKRPVVILPGIYETWQFMKPMADHLHELGHPVHVVSALRRNTGAIPASAGLVLDYLRGAGLTDVILVAHSKGGLIGKYAMLHDEENRIDRMIAIASPFSGSIYARYLLSPALRAFSPNDSTLLALGAQMDVNARIVSISPRYDTHIPNGSLLTGAVNVPLRGSGHFKIIGSREVEKIVDDAIDRPLG